MSDVQMIDAVKAGDLEIIQQLIASDIDINQQDEQGWTPLNWAAGKGDITIVNLLIEKGADVTKVGRDLRTPYMIALAAGHAEVVKLLREAERNVGVSSQRERLYCKAYHLGDLRQFPYWAESKINWKEKGGKKESDDTESEDKEFSNDGIVFLHQDFTVTQSMWINENVIFNQVTPEWEQYCTNTLKFKVPDDLDLIASVKSAKGDESVPVATESNQDNENSDIIAPFEGV